MSYSDHFPGYLFDLEIPPHWEDVTDEFSEAPTFRTHYDGLVVNVEIGAASPDEPCFIGGERFLVVEESEGAHILSTDSWEKVMEVLGAASKEQ